MFIEATLKNENMKPKEQWLRELKENARIRYGKRFDEFCKWIGKTDTELVEEYKSSADKEAWSKRMGSIVVQYYQKRLETGYSINSARSDTIAPRSFFSSQCQEVKIARGKIAKAQIAMNEHSFTQDELKKMFHYGDLKAKAILSTAVSLGWSSIDFLNLEVSFIKPYIEKATAEKQDFVQFVYTREKTDEPVFATLMPETIESLDAYLKTVPEDAKYLWYSPSNHNEPISNKALNDILKTMVKDASILTVGDVKFNLIRKFTFSTLQRYGFSESESRVSIGKTVSHDVLTYLINLKDTLLEKYKKAYVGLTLLSKNGNGRIDTVEKTLDVMLEVLRDLVKERMHEKGLLKKTSPIDWNEIYEKLLPESERKVKVKVD